MSGDLWPERPVQPKPRKSKAWLRKLGFHWMSGQGTDKRGNYSFRGYVFEVPFYRKKYKK